jgi:hypothetical protein
MYFLKSKIKNKAQYLVSMFTMLLILKFLYTLLYCHEIKITKLYNSSSNSLSNSYTLSSILKNNLESQKNECTIFCQKNEILPYVMPNNQKLLELKYFYQRNTSIAFSNEFNNILIDNSWWYFNLIYISVLISSMYYVIQKFLRMIIRQDSRIQIYLLKIKYRVVLYSMITYFNLFWGLVNSIEMPNLHLVFLLLTIINTMIIKYLDEYYNA